MANDDAIVTATADIERQALWVPLALNLLPYTLTAQSHLWASGAFVAALAILAAALSQWCFRRCAANPAQNHASYAPAAYGLRRLAIGLWLLSAGAFMAGALY